LAKTSPSEEDVLAVRQSQAALAVFVRDLLVTNVARAANLTLLRRDAVLATRPALDQRKRDRVRLSAFLPDKLLGFKRRKP